MGCSVDDFFKDIEKTSSEGKALPAWHGELYLEFHRGTYTSHGSIKKGNRKSEILLRDVELVATLASVLQLKKYTYPKQKIDDNWERLLLCQFHDVLPGSSIGMVYDDAEKIYANMSQCHLKKGNWKRAVETADQVRHPLHILRSRVAPTCIYEGVALQPQELQGDVPQGKGT